MNDCKYPNCGQCELPDCNMESKDIIALLKCRRWMQNPEFYRQKQRDYRNRVRENLPHCNQCKDCIMVRKDKGDGHRRLCVAELRLIEQKVSNSPHWCRLRKGGIKSGNERDLQQ